MRIPGPAADLLKVRALGTAAPYAVVVLLATAFFFFLHHLGNRIPYDLAQQRFEAEYAEFAAGRRNEGVARGYTPGCEYCEMSESVMAGAERAGEESAFRDAVMLRTFATRDPGYCCYELDAAAHGAEVREVIGKTRYWWGSKALYAIALRYLSVQEIREFTLISTRAAYLLLAVSLVLLVPGALPAAAPLLVFGAFFSGVEYWTDVANGPPYLWTVLSAAILAWLVRGGTSSGVFSGPAPVWCFAAGTVSSYLWLADSHTFLAVTWIGLLVWFGHGAPDAAERTRRAASCMALYVGGFLACFGLGLVVKTVVGGRELVWEPFWTAVGFRLGGSVDDIWLARPAAHAGGHVESFYEMAWPGWLPGGVVSTSAAVSALAVSVGFAIFRARRGRFDPLRGVSWTAGLAAISAVNFVMVDDIPHRTARFMFVPLALCWSCLVLSVRTMDWKLSSAALGVVLALSGAVSWSVSWYVAASNARAMDELIAGVGDSRPIIGSNFDVYLEENRLVYVKEECGDEDVDARFFLHLYPVDAADLPKRREPRSSVILAALGPDVDAAGPPDRREPDGFGNFDFDFREVGRRGDGRCAAVRGLPEYEIASIHTGQYRPGRDPEWSARVSTADRRPLYAALAGVEDTRPIISADFDVYLDGNRLVYVKEECGDEDVDARFFLHLYPVDAARLPAPRRPHGFDNLDFAFERYGFRARGRCAAARILPEYGIASIHTGQFAPGRDPDWDERVYLDAQAPGLDR